MFDRQSVPLVVFFNSSMVILGGKTLTIHDLVSLYIVHRVIRLFIHVDYDPVEIWCNDMV